MARRLTITCNSSHGTMRCASCHKPIEQDDKGFTRAPYAYYETSEAYVTFHRACTENNPVWAKFDEDNTKRAAHETEFIAACKAFRQRWDVDDLDHYIDAVIDGDQVVSNLDDAVMEEATAKITELCAERDSARAQLADALAALREAQT